MPKRNLGRFRSNWRLMLTCLCAFLLAAAGTSLINSRSREAVEATAAEGGYDFGPASDESNSGAGPKLGERIDLSHFKGREGVALGEVMGGRAAVIALVDYECDMVKDAAGQMRGLREDLAQRGIGYYVVSLDWRRDRDRFFRETDSLGLQAAPFLWAEGEEIRPAGFWTMVRPSHLLLDGDGTILLKWPGTSADPQTRRRMRQQIIADTLNHARMRPS